MKKRALAWLLIMLLGIGGLPCAAESDALRIGLSGLSGPLSPFYADSVNGRCVTALTQVNMLTLDRSGEIVRNAIDGETRPCNGVDYACQGAGDVSVTYDVDADETHYRFTLRDGLRFWDGESVTIDDVIFNYYVYLDPAYDGPAKLAGCDIPGLREYRLQVPSTSLEAFDAMADAVREAGPDRALTGEEPFSAEAYAAYYGAMDDLWRKDAEAMLDYIWENFSERFCESQLGLEPDESLKGALAIALWGFGEVEDDVLTTAAGNRFSLAAGELPGAEDYFLAASAAYGHHFGDYLKAGESRVGASADEADQALCAQLRSDLGIGERAVAAIEGIRRVDDRTVEVTTRGYRDSDVYALMGMDIAPMHYYGDPGQYDYPAGLYGHPFGDLSLIRARDDAPMGAGPYGSGLRSDGEISLQANPHYWLGAPSTGELRFEAVEVGDIAEAVGRGDLDLGEIICTRNNMYLMGDINLTHEINGDHVNTLLYQTSGYGYVGINADTVNVGGDPGSEASRNLRKGLATVLAIYRERELEAYFSDFVRQIESPLPADNYAARQEGEADYSAAFSVDVDGNQLYSEEMEETEWYEAARKAAIGYFKAAGYTYDERMQSFVAAPEGALLRYEILLPGGGISDHPLAGVVGSAKAVLDGLGIELRVNDLYEDQQLWDVVDAGNQQLWCAAWSVGPDPDLYGRYHSSNILGEDGTNLNLAHLRSASLDALLERARSAFDPNERRALYLEAQEEIMDWAVEVPVYQRMNLLAVSAPGVELSSLPEDFTAFHDWLSEAYRLKAK